MAIDKTPWFVGGGAEHSAALARILAHAATGGASGVVRAHYCRVVAAPTPNGTVIVRPGAVVIPSTFAGGSAQSYIGHIPSSTSVSIQPTSSTGGRSDLIVLTVTDPEYIGSAPTDPNDYDYFRVEVIAGVPSSTTSATQVAIGKPAVALARVDLPSNTGTVQSNHIKDLRELPNPRRERNLMTIYPSGYYHDGSAHKASSGGYSSWPIRASERPRVWVPEWATQLQIVINISGAYFIPGTSTDTVLGFRTGFGAEGAQHGIAIGEEKGRFHYSIVGTHHVPTSRRGTDQLINIQANQTRGNGGFWADYQTSVSLDYEFSERAE